MLSHPESSLQGWMVVAASFSLSFLGWGVIYSFGVLLPLLSSSFSVGRAEASLTPALLAFLTLASGPLAAALVRRRGHRAVTLAGVFLAALGFFLASLYTPS